MEYDTVHGHSSGNETVNLTVPPGAKWRQDLKLTLQILLPIVLAVIMLSMGCAITLQEIWTNLKRPWGIIIGGVSQFVLMPLATFGLAHALQLENNQAIGMLVLGCCPGGTVSNIFTFVVDGDVSLSICMTTISTVLAFGMMPLNLLIYTRSWTSSSAVIPYTKIILALISILVPVSLGILLKRKAPKVASVIPTLGSLAGLLCIAIVLVINGVLYPKMFSPSVWRVWLGSFLLLFIGFAIGFAIACLCKLGFPRARTVGFETGCQNVAVALSLIILSFPKNVMFETNIFPLVYGVVQILDCFIIIGIYKLYIGVLGDKQKCEREGTETGQIQEQREIAETDLGVTNVALQAEGGNGTDGNAQREHSSLTEDVDAGSRKYSNETNTINMCSHIFSNGVDNVGLSSHHESNVGTAETVSSCELSEVTDSKFAGSYGHSSDTDDVDTCYDSLNDHSIAKGNINSCELSRESNSADSDSQAACSLTNDSLTNGLHRHVNNNDDAEAVSKETWNTYL